MNKVLKALGLEHLEVAIVVRERNENVDDSAANEHIYDITSAFRYPVREWALAEQVSEPSANQAYPAGMVFEVTDHYAKGAAFWLQVTGDAMTAPVGISVAQGMMILVDPDISAEPGKMVIARVPGIEEATFRQLIEESGQRYLKPLNPTYPKTVFDQDCRIIGVVVQATYKF